MLSVAQKRDTVDNLSAALTRIEKDLRERAPGFAPTAQDGSQLASVHDVRELVSALGRNITTATDAKWASDAAEVNEQIVGLGGQETPLVLAGAPGKEAQQSVVSDVKWSIWGIAAVLGMVLLLKWK